MSKTFSLSGAAQSDAANCSRSVTGRRDETFTTHDRNDPEQFLIDRSHALLSAGPVEPRSIMPRCYMEEGFFRREMDDVFAASWVCVGRVSQLPEAGSSFEYRIADRRILIVCDSELGVVALSPVCRHRGAIVRCQSGSQGSRLVCPYHKWSYAMDGRLVNAPLMNIADGDRAQLGLTRFRCATWLGWIFVNLDGQAEDISIHLGEVEAQLRPWRIDAMVPLCEPIIYDAAFNWKIACDNQGESYHLIGSHSKSVLPFVDPSASRFTTDGKSYVRSWFPAIEGPMGPMFGSRLEGVRLDFNGTWSYNVFPNHMFVVSDDFVIWQQQQIVDQRHYRHVLWVLGHSDVVADPGKSDAVDAVRDGVVRVETEDQASFDLVWAGLLTGDAKPGPFAASERGTLFFQRWLIGMLLGAAASEKGSQPSDPPTTIVR